MRWVPHTFPLPSWSVPRFLGFKFLNFRWSKQWKKVHSQDCSHPISFLSLLVAIFISFEFFLPLSIYMQIYIYIFYIFIFLTLADTKVGLTETKFCTLLFHLLYPGWSLYISIWKQSSFFGDYQYFLCRCFKVLVYSPIPLWVDIRVSPIVCIPQYHSKFLPVLSLGKSLVELWEDTYIYNSGKYYQVFLYTSFKLLNLFNPLPYMYCPIPLRVSMF